MLVIRDVFNCKPGKVRPMVDKFKATAKLSEKMGMGKTRIMTDVAESTSGLSCRNSRSRASTNS